MCWGNGDLLLMFLHQWFKSGQFHSILIDLNFWCLTACVSAASGSRSSWRTIQTETSFYRLGFFLKDFKSYKRLHGPLLGERWFFCILIKECYWRRIQIRCLLLLFVLSVLALWGDSVFQCAGFVATRLFWC